MQLIFNLLNVYKYTIKKLFSFWNSQSEETAFLLKNVSNNLKCYEQYQAFVYFHIRAAMFTVLIDDWENNTRPTSM